MSINDRAVALQQEVESNPTLAEFVKMVRECNGIQILLHQDAFAADYQDREYLLLGMAIKYAGIFGREVVIAGKNRETLPATSAN